MNASNLGGLALPAGKTSVAKAVESILVEPWFAVEQIVERSGFHTVKGVAFGPDGRLFAASVLGEGIFALDLATGAIEPIVDPPVGGADDLAFSPSGDLIWTAFLEGIVRVRSAEGEIKDLVSYLPGVNSIAFTRDGKRLFVGQVFMGDTYGSLISPASLLRVSSHQTLVGSTHVSSGRTV